MSKNRASWLFVAAGALLIIPQAGCGGEEVCIEEAGVSCLWAGQTGRLAYKKEVVHRLDTPLYWPVDMEFGPDGTPYILDWNNHAVRRVLDDGSVETIIGNGFVGDGPPDLSDLSLQGSPCTKVALKHPTDIGFLADGTMLLMAWHNHKLRTWNPDTGMVWVMCGLTPGYEGDGEPAVNARFNQPNGLVVADDGSIYIADQRNFRIRKISAGTDPIVTTVVGTGVAGYAGDGGSPLDAQLRFEAGGNPEPSGAVALGPDGALYIADSLNHRIRRVDLAADRIETVAGNGTAGYSGDGGSALAAMINNPRDIEFGPEGRLYIADTENHVIRVVDLDADRIETYAGTGVQGGAGEGLHKDEIELDRPFGITFDQAGALYISDTFNSRILKVTP
jgi:sugar lactone lactonase YvrE